eukprot:11454234-Alexandrium_andersonii.AAC.1
MSASLVGSEMCIRDRITSTLACLSSLTAFTVLPNSLNNAVNCAERSVAKSFFLPPGVGSGGGTGLLGLAAALVGEEPA